VRPAVQDEHGKIRKALWITERFPEALEADLQRYYNLPITSLGADLSWRRLLVLVEHLPPEGALNTAIRNATPENELAQATGDAVRAPWSTLESLVAALIDEVRQFAWMYSAVHAKNAPKRPEPIRRPGSTGKRHGGKLMRISEIRTLDPRMRNMSDDEIRELLNSPAMRVGSLWLVIPKSVA
jgi:hypothetical protein